MKPTTFESEIVKMLNIYFNDKSYYVNTHNVEGTRQLPNPDSHYTKEIIAILQTTIRESLPAKRDVCAWEDAMERDEHQDLGFNACLDTITSNLQKAGLLV
jgi:hypothetical protein